MFGTASRDEDCGESSGRDVDRGLDVEERPERNAVDEDAGEDGSGCGSEGFGCSHESDHASDCVGWGAGLDGGEQPDGDC